MEINMFKNIIIKYKEIILYILFGGLTTLVNWAVYTILVHYAHIGITLSNAAAWIVSVIFAFITNKLWVFESKSTKRKLLVKEFASFIASRAFTGAMEIICVPLLVKIGLNQTIFGIEGAWSKLIVSIAVVILNYVFSKLIVFKKKKTD